MDDAQAKKTRPEQCCPLCGGENACAIAAGKPATQCWCQSVNISDFALQKIPAESVGKRCLCYTCSQLTVDHHHGDSKNAR